jgi:hypothetical protein
MPMLKVGQHHCSYSFERRHANAQAEVWMPSTDFGDYFCISFVKR